MPYVTVPKDLTKVKSKVLFNLTKRQLICFSLGLLIGVPLYFATKEPLGNSSAAMLMILTMLPAFLFALYEKNGQHLEVIIRNMITALDYQQEEGMVSSLPLGLNQIEIQRGLTSSGVAIFVPFTTQELYQDSPEALYYGINALSNNIIIPCGSTATKTKSSCRTLPLVVPFERLLRKVKQQQEINRQVCGSCYCNDYLEYVNVNAIGELMKPNFITQHFEILLAKNKLKKIRFHDLRHPYVKHTTKNFSCKSRNPKPSNVMVWDFCFDYKLIIEGVFYRFSVS